MKNPEQPDEPKLEQPQQQPQLQPAPQQYYQPIPLTLEQVERIRAKNKTKLIWGLVCLIAPTTILIVSIILYAIASFVMAAAGGNPLSTGRTIFNVIMFIVNLIATLVWLPGIIVGIILLATRKPVQ